MTLSLFTSRPAAPAARHAPARGTAFTVLVAPTALDDHLTPRAVAERMADGVRRVLPDARVLELPVPDGGAGFAEALVDAARGVVHHAEVPGPAGQPVNARWGLLGGPEPRTAVIEVATVAGGPSAPRRVPDPAWGSSEGVGHLIRAALDAGARRILLGCRADAVLDGGLGMLQALGARALDGDGHDVGAGGLARLRRLDLSGLDPRLRDTAFEAALDPNTRLLGRVGVARQWGLDHAIERARVVELDRQLAHLANAIERAAGRWVGGLPGSGAAGGLAASVAGVLGGHLQPHAEIMRPALPLDAMVEYADLIVTADARLDERTLPGAVPGLLARMAESRRVPVIALGRSVSDAVLVGPDPSRWVCMPLAPRPCTAEEAFRLAPHWLADTTERALRLVAVGRRLDSRPQVAAPATRGPRQGALPR